MTEILTWERRLERMAPMFRRAGTQGELMTKCECMEKEIAELRAAVEANRTPVSAPTAGGERQIAPTPRVEAVIAEAMEKYAGGTPGRDLTYYQNVHQDLAPLARQLERELDRTKAELVELRAQMARSAGDAVPAEPRWHAPGMGEVHYHDHSLMIDCMREIDHPEQDYIADEALAKWVCDTLNHATAPAPGNTERLTETQKGETR